MRTITCDLCEQATDKNYLAGIILQTFKTIEESVTNNYNDWCKDCASAMWLEILRFIRNSKSEGKNFSLNLDKDIAEYENYLISKQTT